VRGKKVRGGGGRPEGPSRKIRAPSPPGKDENKSGDLGNGGEGLTQKEIECKEKQRKTRVGEHLSSNSGRESLGIQGPPGGGKRGAFFPVKKGEKTSAGGEGTRDYDEFRRQRGRTPSE